MRPASGSGDLAADPLFSAVGTDFTLQSGSPAKDAGTVSSVYATFQSLYGVSIAKDRNQTLRPVGTWDIGAYKASDGNDAPIPPEDVHILN